MNQTFMNASNNISSWSDIGQGALSEISLNTSLTESIIFIASYLLLIVLSYYIFKSSFKINRQFQHKSIFLFTKAFKFYFLSFILLLATYTISLFIHLQILYNNYALLIWAVLIIVAVITSWIAKTYLVGSVMLKYFYDKFPNKIGQKSFLIIIAILIAIDLIIFLIASALSLYLVFLYSALLLSFFLCLIYKKEGNFKQLTKQIPHLVIIFLILLRLAALSGLFTESNQGNYFEMITAVLTIIFYLILAIRLKKWSDVLTK